jgi:putative DNA primase/helicase
MSVADDLRWVAQVLGGEVAGHDTVLAPGPGHTARDRSLAVRLDATAPDGFLVYSHAGDHWRACRDHVRESLGLPAWEPGNEQRRTIPRHHIDKWDLASFEAEANEPPRAWTEDEIVRISKARRIWEQGRHPRGTLAERYLRDGRKLDLPAELAGQVLRFHPRCPWRDENTGRTIFIPALIVPFRSIDDDSITGIHRIALNAADGTKRGRRMLGIVSRAAIKLDPLSGDTLVIGEGAESCMAARQLGLAPVWALGTVGAISFFPVINGVNQLTILGESGEASTRAIRLCGTRWRRAGRRVRVVMPNEGFSDMNDALIAEGSAS